MSRISENTIPVESQHTVLRKFLNRALFDLQAPLGRWVNIFTVCLVVFAVGLSMVGTLSSISAPLSKTIATVELVVTLLFAAEYILRVWAARWPLKYVFSFYGIIDLLTWLPLLLLGDVNLAIRLLRVLRLLKLIRYLRAMHLFISSLRDSIEVMVVVATAIVLVVAFAGNLIHAIEPATYPNAFLGSWWALVTMTTVGYGDMVPATAAGKGIAAILMIMGITIFAMLTGIISLKIAHILRQDIPCMHCSRRISREFGYCPECGGEQTGSVETGCAACGAELEDHHQYCFQCGEKADPRMDT